MTLARVDGLLFARPKVSKAVTVHIPAGPWGLVDNISRQAMGESKAGRCQALPWPGREQAEAPTRDLVFILGL